MAENATTPALDGKRSVYEAFKKSSHSNCIDVSEYKYMFCKALDKKLMNNWPKLQSGWECHPTFNFSEVKPLEGDEAGGI
eukprot:14561510-Ditylum_brightwellii.AAC.1